MINIHPSGVVFKETFLKARRKWISTLICVSLVYIIAITVLLIIIIGKKDTISSLSTLKQIEQEYRTKERLYGILRTKGYSLGQGIDIVEAVVRKSKELEIPLSLIMAVTEQESFEQTGRCRIHR